MYYDIYFRYNDESYFRPYVLNCSLDQVGFYSDKIARLTCVVQIYIYCHPVSIGEFYEYSV